GDLGEERGAVRAYQVLPDGEHEPAGDRAVRPCRGQGGDPAVGAGLRLADPLPFAVVPDVERDRDAPGRPPPPGVEAVRGHSRHGVTRFRSLIALILPIAAAATSRSVPGSFCIRRRSSARISPALRPVAQMRNTCPNLSSYAAFASRRACSVPSSEPTPDCSAC